MTNQTAIKLLKWITQRHPTKDEEFHQWRSRELWERFSEKSIDWAMRQSSCTSVANLIKLCKFKEQ